MESVELYESFLDGNEWVWVFIGYEDPEPPRTNEAESSFVEYDEF